MKEPPQPESDGKARFGPFEFNLNTGELRKHGVRIKLPDQSAEILAALLERPGQLISREELREKLWPGDTFVDFDHGLNNAMNRLREALGDTAESPRYIETLPRRGYRLIAPAQVAAPRKSGIQSTINASEEEGVLPRPETAPSVFQPQAPFRLRRLRLWVAGAGIAGALILWVYLGRQRPMGAKAAGRIQSIAVLPLENLSGDPSQEYFADGMTDALITDLAQISSLRVISRTSSAQYKQTHKPLPQIGRELNVDAVVEGAVVRSGARVRIDAQLIRADTDQHLWARSYEGDLSQVLALQSAVAKAISSEVRAKLTPEEQARLRGQQTINPEAYELYLRGNYFLDKRTREGMEKALAYYQQATEKDSSSALAFSGLADAYSLLSGFGFLPAKEADPKGKAAAEKAVAIDGSCAEALTALAAFTDDPAKTESLYRQAIDVNPSYALAHHWYARFLSENKRYDEALAQIGQARSLDPLSVRIVVNEGEILFFAGQREKALEQLQAALDMDPNFPVTHWVLGRSLFYARQYDSALLHLRKAIELNPNAPRFHRWLAIVQEFLGRYREAIAEFESTDLLNGMSPAEASARAAALRKALSSSGEQGYWREWIALRMKDREKSPDLYAYNIAYDYAHLGDNAKAVAWLETCLQEKSCPPLDVRTDPGLDGLRSDPRYQSLLARMSSPQ